MGFENRFKGNKAWMWMDPVSRTFTYQFFVFEDREKALFRPPEDLIVARAVFDGEMWVECDEDEQAEAEGEENE